MVEMRAARGEGGRRWMSIVDVCSNVDFKTQSAANYCFSFSFLIDDLSSNGKSRFCKHFFRSASASSSSINGSHMDDDNDVCLRALRPFSFSYFLCASDER